MKGYWQPFNIVFNVIGNILLIVAIIYLLNDWDKMSTFDILIGFFFVFVLLGAHIALIVEWKRKNVRH